MSGDVLVVTTTHLKETYIRRNGLMHSDRATIRTRRRRIGEYLQAKIDTLRPRVHDRTLCAKHDDVGE